MRGRAIRRHHVERLKNTRYWRYRAVWSPGYIEGMRCRLDDIWGPRACSCTMCSNHWRKRPRSNEERREQMYQDRA